MAGDPLKRVQPGDTLEIRASTYNTVVDAVKSLQANRPGRQHQNQPALAQSGIVLVRNDSGTDRGRFDVLGIAGSVFGSSSPEFPNRIVLSGATPTADHGLGFVILQEPIAAGRIGTAVISGITQARVNVENSGDTIAGLDASDPTRLTTSVPGTALILAVDSGAGTQWGIVNVGAALAHQARWIEFTTTEAFATTDADVDVDDVVYHDGYEPDTAITTVYNKAISSDYLYEGDDNDCGDARYDPEDDKYRICMMECP